MLKLTLNDGPRAHMFRCNFCDGSTAPCKWLLVSTVRMRNMRFGVCDSCAKIFQNEVADNIKIAQSKGCEVILNALENIANGYYSDASDCEQIAKDAIKDYDAVIKL